MLSRAVLRQIRLLHYRARRAVEDILGGEYRSVFKGTGIVFDEVREYQPGDDVRAIDWNVTARMGHPFIKRYVEERERTVLLLIDWSASQRFGTRSLEKAEVAAEVAAVLAFSAVGNNDKVGLIGFTERVEHFVPPRKGMRHALRLIRDVLYFQPAGRGTCLRAALDFLNRVQHRRAIVFLLSDFLDSKYEAALKRTGRAHEVLAVRIRDAAEDELPRSGFWNVEDPETGARLLVDVANRELRRRYAERLALRRRLLIQAARSARIDLVDVKTDGSHLEALVRHFQLRQRERARS